MARKFKIGDIAVPGKRCPKAIPRVNLKVTAIESGWDRRSVYKLKPVNVEDGTTTYILFASELDLVTKSEPTYQIY